MLRQLRAFLIGVPVGTALLIGSQSGLAQTSTVSPPPVVSPVPAAPPPLSPQGQQALETAPSGTAVQWRNPDTGATSTIVPQPAFQTSGGQVCREFQETVTIGGQPQQAYGTACRQPDGSWKLQPAPAQAPPATAATVAPPPVAYAYPAYFPPAYYYPRPYYSHVFIGGVFVGGHGHFDRDHHHH